MWIGHGSGFVIRNFFPRVNATEGRSYTGAIWAIPSTTYSQSINYCRNRCASGSTTNNEETKGNCTTFLFLYQNASGAVRRNSGAADDVHARIILWIMRFSMQECAFYITANCNNKIMEPGGWTGTGHHFRPTEADLAAPTAPSCACSSSACWPGDTLRR